MGGNYSNYFIFEHGQVEVMSEEQQQQGVVLGGCTRKWGRVGYA